MLVRHVMAHTAGVPGFDPPITSEQLYDLEVVAANLAAQAPWWEPGTMSGYHAITQGNLEGEILYRITGRRMGRLVPHRGGRAARSRLLDEPARLRGTTASGELQPPVMTGKLEISGVEVAADSMAVRTLMSIPQTAREPRTREWARRGDSPPRAVSATPARSPRIHSALACGGTVDGVRLLSEAGTRRALEEQTDGIDQVLMVRMRHGLGFGLQLGDVETGPARCSGAAGAARSP